MPRNTNPEADYKKGKQLAEYSLMTASQIATETKINYLTAHKYITKYRATEQEIKAAMDKMEGKHDAPVTTYTLSDEELAKYNAPSCKLNHKEKEPLSMLKKEESKEIIRGIRAAICQAKVESETEMQTVPNYEAEPIEYANVSGSVNIKIADLGVDDAYKNIGNVIQALKTLGIKHIDISIDSNKIA